MIRSALKKYKDKTPPWGEVGYVTYKRTYARKMMYKGQETREEWLDTCFRAINGLQAIGGQFTKSEEHQLLEVFFNLEGLCSGRALWQLGTETLAKVGADSMQNCWHVISRDAEAFCFTFNQLMLGGGVGFNILPEHVYEMPRIKTGVEITHLDTFDVDFVVPDNREGWVNLLRVVLNSFFVTGKPLTYTTNSVRSRGKPIKTFGGTASGPESLIKGITWIVGILKSRAGKKLRPLDVLDIQNIIGYIVVSGNVRRSAEIACGSPDDMEFLTAKSWQLHKVPNWRAMSNNTVITESLKRLPPVFWDGYTGEGEPYGLLNPYTCRNYGRLVDGFRYRTDDDFAGVNPCGEIQLENKESCNLAELFLPNIENEDHFKHVSHLLYKVTKTISCMSFSDPVTDAVVKKNHRLGMGLTGFVATEHFHDEALFDRVYKSIEDLDIKYSKQLGVAPSKKLTTVKPSGTMSLLAGVPPGGNDAFAEYVIRRIRFSSDDPLVAVCQGAGYYTEPVRNFDGTPDFDTTVIEFPCHFKEGIPTQQKVDPIAQLERQKWLQTHWADNSVSITVYYLPEQLPAIREWLDKNYTEGVKCTSFLRHSGHGFDQAPLEAITKEQYWEMRGSVHDITHVNDYGMFGIDSQECSSGGCPVR